MIECFRSVCDWIEKIDNPELFGLYFFNVSATNFLSLSLKKGATKTKKLKWFHFFF